MLSIAVIAGLVAFAAGSPAPQGLDLAQVEGAPSPTATGPALTANSQTGVYNPTSATDTITVTSIASASGTPATTTPPNKFKRDSSSTSYVSSSATYCWGSYPENFCIGGDYDTLSPPDFFPTITICSTQISATSTTSSSTVCPTQPEAGTSCGFINPEDECAPQPDGYGPHVEPDTVEDFLSYAPFQQESENAVTPAGYVNTFKDLNAASVGNSYLGLHTLTSYDVTGCAAVCDNTTLCTAFNIYIERDPSLNPTGSQCTNPFSITNYKCTLWGSSLDNSTATNTGGNRDSFQVVITGSNGYDKSNSTTPPSCSGWQPPTNCAAKAHNHGSTCIGSQFYPGPYNPSLCAAYAEAQNKANEASSLWNKYLTYAYNPLKCNFFNAYSLEKDNQPLGTYCSLYSKQYSPDQADYEPGLINGHYYSIGSSWSYSCD